jgi:hypothetical protein
MKHLQHQAKQRLCAFLLRYGKCYSGKSNWTQAHYQWLEEQRFRQSVFVSMVMERTSEQQYNQKVSLCSNNIAAKLKCVSLMQDTRSTDATKQPANDCPVAYWDRGTCGGYLIASNSAFGSDSQT